MQRSDTQTSQIVGAGLIALGAALAALGAACAVMAASHMAVAATLCGPAAGHCMLCGISAADLLASLGITAVGVASLRARPAPQHAGRASHRIS